MNKKVRCCDQASCDNGQFFIVVGKYTRKSGDHKYVQDDDRDRDRNDDEYRIAGRSLDPSLGFALELQVLGDLLESPDLMVLPPVSYLAFLGLIKDATLVITDSGGIQEET